jgi:hypothetical protein
VALDRILSELLLTPPDQASDIVAFSCVCLQYLEVVEVCRSLAFSLVALFLCQGSDFRLAAWRAQMKAATQSWQLQQKALLLKQMSLKRALLKMQRLVSVKLI